MEDPKILRQMREEWNERACEDANYYVAFGRRGQEDEEFFSTAADVVRSLEAELKRLPACPEGWAALEIGCGPGRLMRPMSRHFREIHGVDVSDQMVRLAEQKLRGIPHARAHVTSDSSLGMLADDSFDFVYSYAVFQHIPSREVVLQYLREARRVLRPDGILRCQINGLPEQAARYTTWSGVRIPAADVVELARRHDFQLLALEGVSTQYMWTTWRKKPAGWRESLRGRAVSPSARIRNISNAHSGEPLVPAEGPMAAASLWIEQLPEDCDLIDLVVTIDGKPGRLGYLGPPAWDGIHQLNVALPPQTRSGLVPLVLHWLDAPLSPPAWLRVIPAGPAVPRVCSVTDGVNLLSGTRIESGSVKVTLEEVAHPEWFEATMDGLPVREIDFFCTDPLTRRFEVNFRLPEELASGGHLLHMRLGKREFAPVSLRV
ncbi:MAG TPA: class I SAM-dependent methyltransferase [Bryobacteraceae bacterium]|nr:class I SAM-dependent methyltransferase [Bryobacteraceae bacterium]